MGRQSTVDATDDTIADVGKELLDACFSLKSPGTLWKHFYGIKNFYSWHIENVGPDWLPMRESAASWELMVLAALNPHYVSKAFQHR